MVKIIYKPYKIKLKKFLIKRKIFINNIIYYPLKYFDDETNNYQNIILQTPIMFIPFELSNYNSVNNYIDISFNSYENDEDINQFLEFVKKINTHFEKLSRFKKYNFRSSLKPKINIFPERLRLTYNEKNNIIIFNENKQKLDRSHLKSKMYGKFIIQISNIWINKNKNEYGIIWNICQIKLLTDLIYKPEEYSFIDDVAKDNNNNDNNNDNNNNNNNNDINDKNPKYKQYFFMFKIGLSKEAITHKLIQDGLDPLLTDIITGNNQNKETKFTTIKKPNRTDLFNDIKKSVPLKKITIIKKKSPINNNNNLVPSHNDILNAWSKIVNKK